MNEEGQDGVGVHTDIKAEESVSSDCPGLPTEMPVIKSQPLERQVRNLGLKCLVLAEQSMDYISPYLLWF